MNLTLLKQLYLRDLEKVSKEVSLYPTNGLLWKAIDGISNPGGNLCLHLVGNLNTYIGAVLAGTDYKRQRDLEFSSSGLTKQELLDKLESTSTVVAEGLSNLTTDQLEKDFPIVIWEKEMSMEYTLIYLLTHLNYHLGQINYHRRLSSAHVSFPGIIEGIR
jgi:uncharacterized protein DUF1572